MKPLLFFFLCILLTAKAPAQTLCASYSAAAFVQYHNPLTDSSINEATKRRPHCGATVTGGKIALWGGGMLIGGAALLLAGESQRKPYQQAPAYEALGAAAVLTGLPMTVIGGIVFIVGEIHDNEASKRISVSWRMNEIGLAYNLR